jgi:outer membrane protein
MKKLPIILSSLALVAAVLAIVLVFARNGNGSSGPGHEGAAGESDLKIAYILTDSVLVSYELSIDLQEEFHDKQQQYNLEFGQKRTDLEKQAVAFQEKLQRGGFLSQDRAMKERDRILGQEEEMKRLDYELSMKLAEMEQKIQKQLADSIVSYVKEYNNTHGYTYILSNNGNIIVGEPKFNITKDVVDGLNARYAASKKSK